MSDLLEHMIRDILGKLELLADGKTQNLDPDKVMQGHAESSPPGKISLTPSYVEPKKDKVSLFEWYRWQFERHRGDERRLRGLIELARDDYEDFRFRADALIEVRRGREEDNDPHDGGAAERAHAARVVDWYEGRSALYVAYRESQMGAVVTEAWVRKARSNHRRDPEDGRPLPDFRGWDDERRRAEIASLSNLLPSQEAVANHLGVAKSTVQRYWPREAQRQPVAA